MKHLLLFVFFMGSILGNSQDFQGQAVYQSKTSTKEFVEMMSQHGVSPDRLERIKQRMQNAFNMTFILTFDKSSSIYKEEERLDAPGEARGGRFFRMMSSDGGGTLYKDVKANQYCVDKEFFGKLFYIEDQIEKIDWKLENQTKKIGNYTCYKATAVVKVKETNFSFMRRGKKGDKKEEKSSEETKSDQISQKKENSENEQKQKTSSKKTLSFDDFEMPKETTITAWYSPEIPVSNGPSKYGGLPGLILEVNDGRTVLLCTKITLNSSEKQEIKPVKKGKKVTQEEFEQIVKKKTKEMRQMYQGRGGHGRRYHH